MKGKIFDMNPTNSSMMSKSTKSFASNAKFNPLSTPINVIEEEQSLPSVYKSPIQSN